MFRKALQNALSRLAYIGVGVSYASAVGGAYGCSVGVGAALALNPAILLAGVMIGALAVPFIHEVMSHPQPSEKVVILAHYRR